jgi:putative phosphoribosyl transferase
MLFTDRPEAGRMLAEHLGGLRGEDPVVLALPRGGVPVAYPVARALDAPLDVLLVRKLGVPSHPEVAYGALGEGGARVLNEDVLAGIHTARRELDETEHAAESELARQAGRFRGDRPRIPLGGRTAILVDDGIATGATASAACRAATAQGAARVVLAVPVAPPDAVATLRRAADEVVCLSSPEMFFAVGEWYRDFSQTTDDEVVDLLTRSRTR